MNAEKLSLLSPARRSSLIFPKLCRCFVFLIDLALAYGATIVSAQDDGGCTNCPPEPPGFRHWSWKQHQQSQVIIGGGSHADDDSGPPGGFDLSTNGAAVPPRR